MSVVSAIAEMDPADKIALVTASLTLALVCATVVYVWVTWRIQKATERQAAIQAEALEMQNQLLKAQLLAQRFDMYWKAREPVTAEQLADADLIPDDYMDPRVYERHYKQDPRALSRYLRLASCYEYLAFAHTMKLQQLPDPLGYEWTEAWARDLASHPEFLQVNDWYADYYPEFSQYVRAVAPERQTAQRAHAGEVRG